MTCEPWPIVWSCDDNEGSPEQRDAAESAARTILWSRTGRRLGLCTAQEAYRPAGGALTCGRPYMTDDRLWHNGGRSGAESCAIDLVSAPVVAIEWVKVFGVLVDPSTYRLERNQLVARGTCWPYVTPDVGASVEVRYRWGVPLTAPVAADPDALPPVDAVEGSPLWGLVAAAMGEVAGELLKGMCGGECRLPNSAVSVTRMGVTVQRATPSETAQAMLLGLEIADQLIMSVNPHRKQQRSRVYSPDMATRV